MSWTSTVGQPITGAGVAAALFSVLCWMGTSSATASAATPVAIGAGSSPVVAVDSGGTAHIAYETPNGEVGYCKLPRGATACSLTKVLTATSSSRIGGLNIFAPSPTSIRIFGGTQCGGSLEGVVRFASATGGASFVTTCKTTGIGGIAPTHGANLLDAQDRFLGAGGAASGRYFLALPSGTTTTAASSIPIFSTYNDYEVSLAKTGAGAGGRLVAAARAYDAANHVKYAVFPNDADDAPLADLNNPAKWIRDLQITGTGDIDDPPLLAGGPAGIFIAYENSGTGADRIDIRKFNPATNTFGTPVHMGGTARDTNMSQIRFAQDPSGRLHLAWSTGGLTRLRYTTSTDGFQTSTTAGSLAESDNGLYRPDVAAAPDGQGTAVYEEGSTIMAVPLVATPDPVDTPPPPAPASPPPPPPPPIQPDPKPAPYFQATRTTVAGGVLTFETPRSCIAPGGIFVVKLRFAKQRRKSNLFVKVSRVDLFIGAKRVKIDRRAPFRQTLRVKASTRGGSRLSVRARAYIKVRRGKSPKKSIRATIAVCESS